MHVIDDSEERELGPCCQRCERRGSELTRCEGCETGFCAACWQIRGLGEACLHCVQIDAEGIPKKIEFTLLLSDDKDSPVPQ
jgi:hypothetical protein